MPRSALFALLAVLCLLAGCRGPQGSSLRFSTWGSLEEIATLKPILADFERANPDVKVELVHVPEAADYPHQLRLLIASGRAPDVVFMDNQGLSGFADRGVFRDLAPFLASGSVKASEFYPQGLSAMSWKGHLYGLPRDLSNLAIFYNRQLFDEAKEPYPQAGWTLAQMREKAIRLTHALQARQRDRWGMSFSQYPIYWLPYLWSDGADVMDRGLTRCTLRDPKAVSALRFYANLRLVDHAAPTDVEMGSARPGQMFAQGKLAMLVGGRWIVPGYREHLKFPWDVAPFPAGTSGSVVDVDASGWCITTATRRPEQAWRLVTYLAGRKSIASFAQSGLIVPSRPDVANTSEFLAGIPEHGKVFLDVLASGRPTLTPPSYDEIVYELIDGLEPAWNGTEPLERALDRVSRRVDALLAEDRS